MRKRILKQIAEMEAYRGFIVLYGSISEGIFVGSLKLEPHGKTSKPDMFSLEEIQTTKK